MKRNGNPYPEMITDESSGIKVPNIAHRIWTEGFEAGLQVADEENNRETADEKSLSGYGEL